jgi:hypothetical protein
VSKSLFYRLSTLPQRGLLRLSHVSIIIEDKCEWVLEDSNGFIEADAMISNIACSLCGVPLESHVDILLYESHLPIGGDSFFCPAPPGQASSRVHANL